MRLTLRALLAYLDDVLEPATLKEIGVRVSESPSASATVARIKEVIRRRRISAPELTGSGSAPDPNLVAEYLDNTLSPDTVPALEKLCLDSDMHLAEVASSHQILTAVLGEPVEVPLATRERMYALVTPTPLVGDAPPPKSGVHNKLRDSAIMDTSPALEAEVTGGRPVMPDYLKPAKGRNLVVLLVSGCVALGWILWVLNDQGVFSSRQANVASNEKAAPVVGGAVHEPTSAPHHDHEKASTPVEGLANHDDEPVEPLVAATESSPVPEPDADGSPTDQSLARNETTAPQSAIDEPAAVMSDPAAPDVKTPEAVGLSPQPEPAPPAPATNPFPAMMYSNAEGILLVRDRESGAWNVLPRRALVRDGDEIASPVPFQAEFTVESSALAVTLHRGTRVRLEPGTGAELFKIYVDRGRVSIERSAGGEHPEPISMGLSIRGQNAQIALNEPGTMCGIEVEQRVPFGRRPDPLLLIPGGGFYVTSGNVAFSWNGGPAVNVGADVGWAGWPVPPNPMVAGPQRPIPNWLTPEGIPQTNADRKGVQMFEKEFNVDQTVDMSIPSLVMDRREMISTYATSTLGLVDDIPMLVKALQSEHEKTRQAAISSLRSWLPTDPNNTTRLEQEVARIFPEDSVADVVDLLWGYSRDDGKDVIISQKLVAFMDHKQIAVRELAFYYVSQITPRTSAHGYRPSLADSPRHAALVGWRNLLEKNGGQLVK
ncbi:MAG: hypothetical protein DWH81_01690 [Planctomycetota bacterium]|nr:MAG: hypothetical protein DWH81_01690 [Planctomycetota bacterium]